MKRASKPLMVGLSRKARAKEASCFSHWYLSLLIPAQRFRWAEESTKTTSNEEWKESNDGCECGGGGGGGGGRGRGEGGERVYECAHRIWSVIECEWMQLAKIVDNGETSARLASFEGRIINYHAP